MITIEVTCSTQGAETALSDSQLLPYLPSLVRSQYAVLGIDPDTPDHLIRVLHRGSNKENRNTNYLEITVTLSDTTPAKYVQRAVRNSLLQALDKLMAERNLNLEGITLQVQWVESSGIVRIGNETYKW